MEFDVAPASTGVTAALIAIIAFILAFALFFAWIALASARMSLVVEEGSLRLRAPFYGRSIPLERLDLASARVVDLDTVSGLRPRSRTNGIGMPGLGVGWFRLQDGTKALLAVTDRRKVLHLPTRDGFDLLASVKEPARLLEELRSRAGV